MTNPEQESKKIEMHKAMRAHGEGDFPDSFKQARNGLQHNIDGFLQKLAAMQAKNEQITLNDGSRHDISTEPQITDTFLGKHPRIRGVNQFVSEHTPGVSLHGDGVTTPYVLHVVRNNSDGSTDTLKVTGTDPMIPTENELPKYAFDYQTKIAGSISVGSLNSEGTTVKDCTIFGDGRVDVPVQNTDADIYAQKADVIQAFDGLLGIEMAGLLGRK